LPGVIKDLHFVQAILPYLEIVKENPVVSLNNDEANLASDFFSLLLKVKSYVKENTSHNLIENMMMTVLYAMAAVYHKNVGLLPEKKQGRGDEIYRNLRLAIIKNYVKERKISFYANQLCITAKHLTAVVMDVSGRSVSDLISSMVILDAKSKLKYSQLTISQIADSLNFPDSSFFGKYFKKHTGLSPKEYRKRE
jgi:YesN/AraC family two-component response regulator